MSNDFSPRSPLTTPVLFLIYKRSETTERVFNAIRIAKPQKLFIAADGPKRDLADEAKACQQVRKIATAVDWECEVKTLFRNENLGCRRAVSNAINWFFENVDEGIILEDDCLPSLSFFGFCEELLKRYKVGEYLKKRNPNSLAVAIEKIILNKSAYLQELQRAAADLNWEKEKKILIEFIEKIE